MLSALVSRLPYPVRKRIEHRITLLRAAENTGWTVANNVVRLVIALVVGVWVARYLGAAQFGLFNYVVSFNAILRSLIPLGMLTILLRDLARDPDGRHTILGSAFAVQLIVAVLMMVVAIGVALYTRANDPETSKLMLALSMTMLLMPFEIIGPWFQSQLQAVNVLIANTTSLLLMAAARIWLVVTGAELEAFVYLVIVERTVNIITLLYLYHRSGESIRLWRFNRERAWQSTWEGMPLLWSGLARNFYTRGNEVMLKSLANVEAVGYYAAANRIIELYYIVPMAIVASAMPVIAKSKLQDRTLYLKQLTDLIRVTSIIGICSTVAIGLLAHWLMPFIYGPEFAGASPVLTISLWAAIPWTFNTVTGVWVINEGLAPIVSQKVLVMAGLVALLNWLLIPAYGAVGAATAYLIASSCVFIFWDYVDPRMRNFGYLKLHALMPWWFDLKELQE